MNDPKSELACKECGELKDLLFSGEIDLIAFLRQNAQLALKHGFDELVPRQAPLCPEALRKFHQEPEEEQYRYKPEFWQRKDIFEYLENKEKAKNWNSGCVHWLKELLTLTGDPAQKKIITDRLNEFGISESSPLINKVKEIFKTPIEYGLLKEDTNA